MLRRTFFAAAAALFAAPAVSRAAVSDTSRMPAPLNRWIGRVSMERDDPGFIPYCTLVADGFVVKVLLDGVDQRECITADAAEGWVKRHMVSPSGNLLHFGGELLSEVVYGDVRIVLEEQKPKRAQR